MTILTFILSLFQHGFKARWTTAYFILIGKKTNSTLTYASVYHLLPYFHLYPTLKKSQFQQWIQQLEKERCLVVDGDWVTLTPTGRKRLETVSKESVNGLQRFYDYKEKERVFQSFLLMTQMMSEYSYHNRHYLPVIPKLTTQYQMKEKWQALKTYPFSDVQPAFKHELNRFLDELSLIERYLLSAQLTGHHVIAKTSEQLAMEISRPVFEVDLWIESLKSRLCQLNKEDYPLLSFIIQPRRNGLSMLWQNIYQAVHHYQSIAMMSQQFHKKEGTILDYMVEIALWDEHFPYDVYIAEWAPILEEYYQTHENLGDWRYKEIKAIYPNLPFYSMRLFQIKKGQER